MKSSLSFFLLLLSGSVLAQNPNPSGETPAQQKGLVTRPTIMVFPFFKENQDIRQIIEGDVNNRVVMAKVKESFDNRGFSTTDFLAKARSLRTNEVLNADTQTDTKTMIIQQSGADIAVEVEYDFVRSGSGNSVKVILTAYESSTSASLANKIAFSGKFYTDDAGLLTMKSLDSRPTGGSKYPDGTPIPTVVEDFLNVMQEKFTDIVTNGKYMAVEFGLTANSGATMSTEVGSENLPLSDALEAWIGDNSNSYHIQGVTDMKVVFDVVRIPRVDKQGKNLTPTRYGLDLLRFCNGLSLAGNAAKKLKVERVTKGNTIYVNFK